MITGENNQKIKWLESLQKKKYRQEHGVFIAEGERLVRDGMRYEAPRLVVLSESYATKNDCSDLENPMIVSDTLFGKIAETVHPQGILAVFPMRLQEAASLQREGSVLLLNKVMDPGNMGTLLRTAEAAGFSHVVLDKGCVDVYNPKVVRSTMSALFRLHLYYTDSLCSVIESLQPEYTVCAAALDETAVSLYRMQFPKKTAIVIGNEANGIEADVLQLANHKVMIPMEGEIESLNAAVSGALCMYEYKRQKEL